MPSPAPFSAVTRPTLLELRGRAAVTSFEVDATWFQGKGAYGGVLAAAMLESMALVVDDARRKPRGLHVNFCAPVPAGVHVVEVRLERMGALVCHMSARALALGEVIGMATATFGAARVGGLSFDSGPAPAVPPLEAAPVLESPAMPAFCQHFEYRPCLGHLPWSGAEEAWFGGWIRPRVATPLSPGLVVGLLDAFPPAVLARADAPRPAASVELTVRFAAPVPAAAVSPDGRALLDTRSRFCLDGYAEESTDLWSEDGSLLAQCHQVVALL